MDRKTKRSINYAQKDSTAQKRTVFSKTLTKLRLSLYLTNGLRKWWCGYLGTTWRDDIVRLAFAYAEHTWVPSSINAYHGLDPNGVLVDTPDAAFKHPKFCGWWLQTQPNIGVPYMRGGWSTLEEFDNGINDGNYGGNVSCQKVKQPISQYCVGVDCSGLVSRCWGMDHKLSTRTIPGIASPLSSMNLLLPGDVLLLAGRHVMLFIDFNDEARTTVKVVDAAKKIGKVLVRSFVLTDIVQEGFKPYRRN